MNERWTIYVCKDCRQLAHGPGSRCAKDRRRTWTQMTEVQVMPVEEHERIVAELSCGRDDSFQKRFERGEIVT